MAEVVGFDLRAPGATVAGYVAGLSLGLWERLRLSRQVELRQVGSAPPELEATRSESDRSPSSSSEERSITCGASKGRSASRRTRSGTHSGSRSR